MQAYLLNRVHDWETEERRQKVEIRKAKTEDIPQIINLLYQVQKVHSDKRPDLFRPGGKKYTESQVETILTDSSRPVFVAVEEGMVTGYAFCILQQAGGGSLQDRKTLYIDDLCVDQNQRGQHIGTGLYRHVLQFAKCIGCYNVTLNVWACNEEAMKFYQGCGLTIQKYGMETII